MRRRKGFLLLLLWGLMIHFGLAQEGGETPENYQVTQAVLASLKKAGLPPKSGQGLLALLDQTYASRGDFLAALQALPAPPEASQQDLIARHARVEQFTIHSEEFSGDLNAGEVLFKGKVEGEIAKDDIRFWAEKVRIQTEGQQNYKKIYAETQVRVQQGDRQIWADYVVYDRESQTLQAEGNVRMETSQGKMTGSSALLRSQDQAGEVLGPTSALPSEAVHLEFDLQEEPLPATSGTASSARSTIQAQRVSFDKARRQATFEGQVQMVRPQRQLYLKAGKVLLRFAPDQKLLSGQADQGVCLEQPSRVARADHAFFDEPQQMVKLEGRAEVSTSGRYLSGQVIQLFLDVNRGEAKGDQKSPLKMVIPLGNTATPTPAPEIPPPFTCKPQ